MFSSFLKQHFLPFVLALIAFAFFAIVLVNTSLIERFEKPENTVSLSSRTIFNRGQLPNLVQSQESEVILFNSLKCSKQITLFGSSELTKTSFGPYHFLPDSIGQPCWALGHAHHQSFSILCELLANQQVLKNSKICVVVSLSWFETNGTNSEAFVEFVRPNFLSRILNNPSISAKYHKHISNTIKDLGNNIQGENAQMRAFKQQNATSNKWINEVFGAVSSKINIPLSIPNVNYKTLSCDERQHNTLTKEDFTALKMQKKEEFLKQVTNNNYWVYDEYYTKYLVQENGGARKGHIHEINLENNIEWEDFKLLVELLSENNADASFVIQPLNPYFYEGIENYVELDKKIVELLNYHDFQYLNMYVSDTSSYDKGTLMDVMHLGDYGWMQINEFLVEQYIENE